jgi:hypothetical protein
VADETYGLIGCTVEQSVTGGRRWMVLSLEEIYGDELKKCLGSCSYICRWMFIYSIETS